MFRPLQRVHRACRALLSYKYSFDVTCYIDVVCIDAHRLNVELLASLADQAAAQATLHELDSWYTAASAATRRATRSAASTSTGAAGVDTVAVITGGGAAGAGAGAAGAAAGNTAGTATGAAAGTANTGAGASVVAIATGPGNGRAVTS
jgi:hypothetical protein